MDIQRHSTAHSRALHQYACVHCRQRRVKCDKILSGCANCKRHSVQCVYSARRPRKSQKTSPETTNPKPLLPALDFENKQDHSGKDMISDDGDSDDNAEEEDAMIPRGLRKQAYSPKDTTEAAQGRLIVDAGKSHYINNQKARQVSYFETVLASDTTATAPSASTDNSLFTGPYEAPNATALLGGLTTQPDLRSLYPAPSTIPILWDYYIQNVDSLFKLIYKPHVSRMITDVSNGLCVDVSAETLMFAICYAAIASTPCDTCQSRYGTDKKILVHKFRVALEKSLLKANWMTTQEIAVIQSLVIWLVFASENSRSTWIICGIVMSLAQAQGLHMESSSFSLTLIDSEVRRRVWWMLCQIDVRVSDNCGLEPHVPLTTNIQLPLHINDADLEKYRCADDIEFRDERTEMTVTLVKLEMVQTKLRFRRYKILLSSGEDRESVIQDQLQRYRDVYLKYFDDDSEYSRFCCLGIRFIMARLWKLMYDASQAQEPIDESELDEPLLRYNADILEIAYQLPDRYRQFGWFFRCKYTQWHALAYILIQLCKHTQGTAVERAWEVVDAVIGDSYTSGSSATGIFAVARSKRKNSLWQPLLNMLAKARYSRAKALQSPRVMVDTPLTLESDSNTNATTPNALSISSWPDGQSTDQNRQGILGDPFFGQSLDFGEEMNWEQIDAWVNNFQAELTQDEEMIHVENKDTLNALNWW